MRELRKLDCEVTNTGFSTRVSSLAVCVEKRYTSAVYMPCSTLKLYFWIIGEMGTIRGLIQRAVVRIKAQEAGPVTWGTCGSRDPSPDVQSLELTSLTVSH